MIQGPRYNPDIHHIHPVDPDRQEDENGRRQKKRVVYQGRAWTETDEDLPAVPSVPQTPQKKKERNSAGVYASSALVERAQALFDQLTTLEEKVAQLCFLATEAIYDAAVQNKVEFLIQTIQMGGILFLRGDYRRQTYLIEHYGKVSKTPLLFANDFLHGLSFYLQGDTFPDDHLSEKHYSDLGKTVMAQNRRLGVHIQFDRERSAEKLSMSELHAKAFRKGIRETQGIVGKEKGFLQQESPSHSAKGGFSFQSLKEGAKLIPTASEHFTQETISFKTLTFFDATQGDQESLEERLLGAFKQLYDVFLLSGNVSETIRALVSLVSSGKLPEEVLDRHVMKVLIIKSLFYK